MIARTIPQNATSETAGEVCQFVTLRLNGQLIGLPIDQVRDVFQVQGITGVPMAPGWVNGLVNLRGRIVIVLSLAGLLGMPKAPPEKVRMAVGIDWRGETYGIEIDRIGDVLTLPLAVAEPVPGHLGEVWTRHARRIFKLPNELLIELDLHSLIDIPLANAA